MPSAGAWRLLTVSPRAGVTRRRCELSGLSEGQARGGGSRPEVLIDASSLTGAEASIGDRAVLVGSAASLLGNRADDEAAWHAGVQQSIFPPLDCFAGILPSIVQAGIPLDGAAVASAVATADSASPSAQNIEISSRITRARIGGKGGLSMNMAIRLSHSTRIWIWRPRPPPQAADRKSAGCAGKQGSVPRSRRPQEHAAQWPRRGGGLPLFE